MDALLDLVVAENLETGFLFAATNTNPDAVRELITNPHVLIGLSDAGAHVDQSCNAGVPTYLLHEWVHKRKVMSVEEAVRRFGACTAALEAIAPTGCRSAGSPRSRWSRPGWTGCRSLSCSQPAALWWYWPLPAKGNARRGGPRVMGRPVRGCSG
ncbi:MAG: hypothetical protein HYZ72_04400, partial [Deltaproteobacteria bacterium]|nr:hypothetical protein [Deltaproteobacteria bacterium]